MSQALIWLRISLKRLWRKPGFLIALFSIPVSAVLVSAVAMEVPARIRAAVCTDESPFAEAVLQRLLSVNSGIDFYYCPDREMAERDVATGKAECGYDLREEIREGMDREHLEKLVPVWIAPGSLVAGMASEMVFACIYEAYSPEAYVEYMESLCQDEIRDGEGVRKIFRASYDKFRSNGSTFQFQFEGETEPEPGEIGTSLVRFRGIIAVVMLISSLCAVVESKKDQRHRRFLWAEHELAVRIGSDMIAVFVSCFTGFCTIALTPEWNGFQQEISGILIYAALLLVICILMETAVSSETWVVSMIPFAAVGSMILSPVFYDFSLLLPVLRWLRWCSPVTYYLRFFVL